MAERELGCPESTYRYLQALRNQLISAKIEYRDCERRAEEYKALGWFDEAERMLKRSQSWLKMVREIEGEIAELEKLCFGKEKKP